jgi:hypothetical protein
MSWETPRVSTGVHGHEHLSYSSHLTESRLASLALTFKKGYGATMPYAMRRQYLEQAERHVAQGERHIATQKLIVSDLARLGHDTTQARKLLENFYASQVQHIRHRDRLRRELEVT